MLMIMILNIVFVTLVKLQILPAGETVVRRGLQSHHPPTAM